MFELAADCSDCDITSVEQHIAAPIPAGTGLSL